MQIASTPSPRAGRHRWLVSYADFVTLLLAVFVVLFAAERHGNASARRVSQVMAAALKARPQTAPAAEPSFAASLPGPRPDQATVAELTGQLRQEIADQDVTVRSERRGIVVSLQEALLFPPGRADISPASYPVVEKLARILTGVPNPVRLEGHTDNTPIRNARFKNNWELSAARGIAVLELLAERYGISRDRLSVAAFAGTVPVGSNDFRDGRAHNRRVDLVILSAQ